MLEWGKPAITLQDLGIARSELEGASGKTVVIYVGEKLTLIVPDIVDYTSKDIYAKLRDLFMTGRNFDITCDTIHIKANKIVIDADVEIHGNFSTNDGITRLNC